ncbi:MAG: L-rhamnose mutarotase [Maribacter sp.]
MYNAFCYACDLVNDSRLIQEYKQYHEAGKAWPEITESIMRDGITDIIETFIPERKKKIDKKNPKVKEWEKLI